MKKSIKLLPIVLSVFLVASSTVIAFTPEQITGEQHLHNDECVDCIYEDLDIFIMDDNGNYFKEVLSPDGSVYTEPITEEDYIIYLYGTISEGYSLSNGT